MQPAAALGHDPPYSMRGAQGEPVGITVDTVTETLRRMDCRVSYVELPWARALVELAAGRVDLVGGAFRRPEREAYAYFAAPQLFSPNRLFVPADAALPVGVTRLAEATAGTFRLGVQLGVSYGPDFIALSADPAFAKRLVRASSRRSLWQMLALHRIDGLIADEASARFELAQLGLSGKIVPTAVQVSSEPATLMFSKKTVTPEFVKRYDRVSEALLKDGSLALILKRYRGEP
jgi:polar amino acid transport system substrate-binding protein